MAFGTLSSIVGLVSTIYSFGKEGVTGVLDQVNDPDAWLKDALTEISTEISQATDKIILNAVNMQLTDPFTAADTAMAKLADPDERDEAVAPALNALISANNVAQTVLGNPDASPETIEAVTEALSYVMAVQLKVADEVLNGEVEHGSILQGDIQTVLHKTASLLDVAKEKYIDSLDIDVSIKAWDEKVGIKHVYASGTTFWDILFGAKPIDTMDKTMTVSAGSDVDLQSFLDEMFGGPCVSVWKVDADGDGRLDEGRVHFGDKTTTVTVDGKTYNTADLTDAELQAIVDEALTADLTEDTIFDEANGTYDALTEAVDGLLTEGDHLAARTSTAVTGTDFADFLEVSEHAPDGTDATLNGKGGDDYLAGGNGNDVLNGDAGDDKIVGEAGNDVLNGGTGKDLLIGSAGNDVLNGGAGIDVLTGGEGADTFVMTETEGLSTDAILYVNSLSSWFFSPWFFGSIQSSPVTSYDGSDHADTITDFESGEDSFVFRVSDAADASAIDGQSAFLDASEAASLEAALAMRDTDDRVMLWDNKLFVDEDLSDAQGMVLAANLEPGTMVTADDISFV